MQGVSNHNCVLYTGTQCRYQFMSTLKLGGSVKIVDTIDKIKESHQTVLFKRTFQQILTKRRKHTLTEPMILGKLKGDNCIFTDGLRLLGNVGMEILAYLIPVPTVEIHAEFCIERAHRKAKMATVVGDGNR